MLEADVSAEIIAIGDEVLIGQVINSNAAFIAEQLTLIGITPVRHTVLTDNKEDILKGLKEAQEHADVIIITGGLGPTKDDITKHTLCEYFNTELVENELALKHLEQMFQRRGRILNELNKAQALQPKAATYLQNNVGTAPGMWFDSQGKIYVSLPGVPREMKDLMQNEVIPRLKEKFPAGVLVYSILRTIGIPESTLAERLSEWEDSLPPHLTLAYLPTFGNVRLRISGKGLNREDLTAEIEEIKQKSIPLIGPFYYADFDQEIEECIAALMLKQNATLSVAESCTGGMIGHLCTRQSGASNWYKGGVISYQEELKEKLLSVDKALLTERGAVSSEVAKAMALGVRKNLGSTWGLATTGVFGPSSDDKGNPVGLLYIGVANENGVWAFKFQLLQDRELNIKMGANYALEVLRRKVLNLPDFGEAC